MAARGGNRISLLVTDPLDPQIAPDGVINGVGLTIVPHGFPGSIDVPADRFLIPMIGRLLNYMTIEEILALIEGVAEAHEARQNAQRQLAVAPEPQVPVVPNGPGAQQPADPDVAAPNEIQEDQDEAEREEVAPAVAATGAPSPKVKAPAAKLKKSAAAKPTAGVATKRARGTARGPARAAAPDSRRSTTSTKTAAAARTSSANARKAPGRPRKQTKPDRRAKNPRK